MIGPPSERRYDPWANLPTRAARHRTPLPSNELIGSNDSLILTTDNAARAGELTTSLLKGAPLKLEQTLASAFGTGDRETAEAARKLGRDASDVAAAAYALWGQSLRRQRDALLFTAAGDDPRRRAAVRGHVTRRLLAELKPVLSEADLDRTQQENGEGS